VIQGNYLGTNPAGTVVFPNGGILLGSFNIVGGTAPGAGNVIVGSVRSGIILGGGVGNTIQGNYIGTNSAGANLGNAGDGIQIANSQDNIIGGTVAGARNIISGNEDAGVMIKGSEATGNVIQGNYIGTDPTGTTPLGNFADGIWIRQGASHNSIGGAIPCSGNIIAFNGGVGVHVASEANSNSIRCNFINDNGGLGIDLSADDLADWVTLNDLGDVDTGTNNFQNFPVIASVSSSGGTTTISGSLNSMPNTTVSLDFYTNPTADSSGYGEGQRYLGSATVITDGMGTVAFTITFGAAMTTTEVLSATATDSNGNTSEFSLDVAPTTTGASLQPDPCNPGHTALVVTGTPGNDNIIFNPVGGSGDINVTMNGVSLGTFHPTSRIIACGLTGNDDLQVAGSISVSAWLYGGDGNDRLKGGAGNDVLLGGKGDDLIAGGNGRDLIIGGQGSDRLVGDAEDDILIAGTTAFDNNDTALCKILAEWTSTRDYSTRIANLMGNGSGASFNARLNDTVFLKPTGPDTTVYDDGAEDILTGSAGQDWFIFNADGPGVRDRATDLHIGEFFTDLDMEFINGLL